MGLLERFYESQKAYGKTTGAPNVGLHRIDVKETVKTYKLERLAEFLGVIENLSDSQFKELQTQLQNITPKKHLFK